MIVSSAISTSTCVSLPPKKTKIHKHAFKYKNTRSNDEYWFKSTIYIFQCVNSPFLRRTAATLRPLWRAAPWELRANAALIRKVNATAADTGLIAPARGDSTLGKSSVSSPCALCFEICLDDLVYVSGIFWVETAEAGEHFPVQTTRLPRADQSCFEGILTPSGTK